MYSIYLQYVVEWKYKVAENGNTSARYLGTIHRTVLDVLNLLALITG